MFKKKDVNPKNLEADLQEYNDMLSIKVVF